MRVRREGSCGSGTHELDVRELKDLGQHGRGEQRSVLDGHVVGVIASVLIRDANLPEEGVGRLAHDHGAEKLAAEPGTTTGGDIGLDDGDLQVRAGFREAVGGGETAAASADNDNVALGVLVKIGEVAAGHLAGDLALADGPEAEVTPLAGHLLDRSLGLDSTGDRDARGMRDGAQLGSDLTVVGRLGVDSDGGHFVGRGL